MRPLALAMKKKRISSQQIGLSLLILVLLLGWGIRYLFHSQKNLGTMIMGKEIYVLITGEIRNPGVYVFEREPSLEELITQAGGLKEQLITENVGTNHLITQGTGVYIGSENGHLQVSTGSMPCAYKVTLKIPISVNTASQEGLDAIPYIGPYLAQKIINYRSQHGPFKTIDEIKNVPGVGKIRYLKIKPYIGV
jgi:competence protein ComEA